MLAGMPPVTYFVALPFVRLEDGTLAPGEAKECHSRVAAVVAATKLAAQNVGALAFSRSGDPSTGDFEDAVVIQKFGEVPEDLSALWN